MDDLTPQLRELIARHFDSVDAIEIVMLLRRSRETYWAPPAVAERLGIREEVAKAKLDALRRGGILAVGAQTGAFRYAPANDALAAAIDDLAAAYDERRVSVINAIYSTNLERLRAFSDAFKVT